MSARNRERKLRIQAGEEASFREQLVYQELERWLNEARKVLGDRVLQGVLISYASTMVGEESHERDNSN